MKRRGRPPGSKNKKKKPFDKKEIDVAPALEKNQNAPDILEQVLDVTKEPEKLPQVKVDVNPGFELPPEIHLLASKIPELQSMLDPVRLGAEVVNQVRGFFDGEKFQKMMDPEVYLKPMSALNQRVEALQNELDRLKPKDTIQTLLNKPWH